MILKSARKAWAVCVNQEPIIQSISHSFWGGKSVSYVTCQESLIELWHAIQKEPVITKSVRFLVSIGLCIGLATIVSESYKRLFSNQIGKPGTAAACATTAADTTLQETKGETKDATLHNIDSTRSGPTLIPSRELLEAIKKGTALRLVGKMGTAVACATASANTTLQNAKERPSDNEKIIPLTINLEEKRKTHRSEGS